MAALHPFKNKVIAITGAASGMGLSLTRYLAVRGARLSLCDIDGAKLITVAQSIKSESPEAQITTRSVDVQNPEQTLDWISSTIADFGSLSGAANLAGIVGKSVGLADTSQLDKSEWDRVIGVNLTGLFLCLKEQLKVIQNGGSIVNAASVAGLVGSPKNAGYAASKHGVVGLTRSAAKEFGHRGIRVNCICPGQIATPMLQGVGSNAVEFSNPPSVIKRMGQPEEVAAMMAYLLGDESKFVTGAAMSIDGGWAC